MNDLLWLLRNTVPVRGERAAAVESWINVLMRAGLGRTEIDTAIEDARTSWTRCGA